MRKRHLIPKAPSTCIDYTTIISCFCLFIVSQSISIYLNIFDMFCWFLIHLQYLLYLFTHLKTQKSQKGTYLWIYHGESEIAKGLKMVPVKVFFPFLPFV